MFASIGAFRGVWKSEGDITEHVMDVLTDDALSRRVTALDRSLGEIAWHIVGSIPEMAGRTGLEVEGPVAGAPCPASAAAIATAYRTAAASLLVEVERNWNDAALAIEDDMYGESWPRGTTLWVLVLHQVHHRGQMSVLIRQAGLRPPEIYGPTRETLPV
jgi:uncharacterized damage-inducible protein DinB